MYARDYHIWYIPEHHHDNHHDGEDGDGTARHVHDEQVHWNLKRPNLNCYFKMSPDLFEGTQCKVPAPFNPKVRVSLSGGVCVHQSASCRTETRGWGKLQVLTRPIKKLA